MRWSSIRAMTSLQISVISVSTLSLYSLIRLAFNSFPLLSSLCSVEHRFLHDALFSPITSLKPSENKFRSLTVNSPPYFITTFFMASTISIIRTCFSKRNSHQHSTLLIPIYNLENKNSSRAK
ncbi:hypothetical protein LINPERPRIM_LOCUS3155, partial [Linum perenne]